MSGKRTEIRKYLQPSKTGFIHWNYSNHLLFVASVLLQYCPELPCSEKVTTEGGKGLFTAVLQPSFYFDALFKYSGCFKGFVKLAFVDWTQKTNSRKMQHFPPQPEHSKSTVVKQRQSKLITKYTAAPTWQKAKGKKNPMSHQMQFLNLEKPYKNKFLWRRDQLQRKKRCR